MVKSINSNLVYCILYKINTVCVTWIEEGRFFWNWTLEEKSSFPGS